jgi:hypothetical protein
MGGPLMQLLAYGAQDVYLTGQPQVTFFKAIYKRYCNFAMEFYKNQISDVQGNGNNLRIPITRYGDMIGQMYFELPLSQSVIGQYITDNQNPDLNWVAERAFSSIELQIGNNTIDKHYQLWWRLYSQLFMDSNKRDLYDKVTTFSGTTSIITTPVVYLPLNFFFNRNPGLYLPLIALQYHEVQLVCTCSQSYTKYFNNGALLWVNYVILDADERKRFASKEHEYLIEQVQFTADTVPQNNGRMRIGLKHPVKELIWCYPNQSGINKQWDYTVYNNSVTLSCNPTVGLSLQTCGTPKMAGIPWVEDGDVVARQTTAATVVGQSAISPLTSVFTLSTPGALNIKSNIRSGAITLYNVASAISDPVTLKLSNGISTFSNTFYLPSGAQSNAALLSSFVNSSQVWVRTQSFGGYNFATANVTVSNTDNLNINSGKHYVTFSNITFTRTTANTLSNLQTITLNVSAPTLGFIGTYGTSSFSNTAISANTVTYSFDNTYGKDYTVAQSDRITYTISNGSSNVTNSLAIPAGQYSDSSLYPLVLSTIQSNIRQIPITSLRPLVFGNVIVSAITLGGGDNIILSTTPAPGKHSFIFSNIEASGGTPPMVISSNIYGTIGNKLGFYTNNTFTNVASYVQVGASNAFTMGTPGYASNVVANAFPTFQYNIASANVKATSYPIAQYNYSVQTLADPYVDTVLPIGTATSNLVIDVLLTGNIYNAYSNTLIGGPFNVGETAKLANAIANAASFILQTTVVRTSNIDFSNAVITVNNGYATTIEGVLTNKAIGSTPIVKFDGKSQLYPAPLNSVGPLNTVKVFFNGQERFTHTGKFLNQVIPLSFHTGNPYPGIYNYSFALKPEDYQPSGTCNFSRIDSVEIVPTMKPMADTYDPSYNTIQSMFAVNYNVLRIKSGMAAVAFV